MGATRDPNPKAPPQEGPQAGVVVSHDGSLSLATPGACSGPTCRLSRARKEIPGLSHFRPRIQPLERRSGPRPRRDRGACVWALELDGPHLELRVTASGASPGPAARVFVEPCACVLRRGSSRVDACVTCVVRCTRTSMTCARCSTRIARRATHAVVVVTSAAHCTTDPLARAKFARAPPATGAIAGRCERHRCASTRPPSCSACVRHSPEPARLCCLSEFRTVSRCSAGTRSRALPQGHFIDR